jgi:hypothetical protein
MTVVDRDDAILGQFDYMRFFNSSTFIFRFRDEKYEINPLYEEIKGLLTKVNTELNKRLPR